MARPEPPLPPKAGVPSTATEGGQAVLYLSYDGMCDPLGESQVLPYVEGLTARGHRITLVSFEKTGRHPNEMAAIEAKCRAAGIEWHPLAYHKRPPVLSTLFDLAALRRLAERLQATHQFDVVHCRSYLTALVGLRLKRLQKVRLLFDMRGFWADERVEGGLWNLCNPLFRAIFRYFKQREVVLLEAADEIVILTERGKQVLLEREDRAALRSPISVIPCCVDFDDFPLCSDDQRARARALLGIDPRARVAAYLGSIGTWYMLDEMLDCFAVELERNPAAIMLFVSRDDPATIRAAAAARGIGPNSLIIRAASRAEVPGFLAAADYGLFFIRPTFSKIASCPTKLGEFLAMGLPVLTNGGVGDVAAIVSESGAGVLAERFDRLAYCAALTRLDALPRRPADWRRRARHWFDLEIGINRYDAVYRAGSSERNRSISLGACDASE